MKLILFDIDGTLLWTDGAGRRAMEGAMLEVYNEPGDPSYRYDGKTDRQIVREQLRSNGFRDDDIDARLDLVLDRYVARLEDELLLDDGARACQGVSALLASLDTNDHALLGLLTGNIERGARRKLARVGIEFARFRINAFGCDAEHRPALPAIAQQRARELASIDVTGDGIVIIGDTPADIACGRSLGVRAIGVATGRYSATELAEHQPAAVFDSFEDTAAVLDAIFR